MTRDELQAVLTQDITELEALVHQADREIAFRRGRVAVLTELLNKQTTIEEGEDD